MLYTSTNVFAEAKKVSPAEIHLISPVDGQVFEAGETIKFVIDPEKGKEFDFLLISLFNNNGDISDRGMAEKPPLEIPFVPEQYVGSIDATIDVRDKNGKYFETEIKLTIKTSSLVEKIFTGTDERIRKPEEIVLESLTREYPILVVRLYKNGITERITHSPDTKYRTKSFFKSKVITVSPTGLVKAIGNGTETVIIENGGFETSILFTVNDKNFPPAKPDSPIKDGLYIIIPILIAMIAIAVYVGKKVFRFLGTFGSK